MIIRAIYYSISDGWGTIGHAFTCPHCKEENNFVDDELDEHECENCKRVVKCKPNIYTTIKEPQ